MDPSAEEREPGILLENSEEESSDTICTGENSKYVSNRVSIVEWLLIYDVKIVSERLVSSK